MEGSDGEKCSSPRPMAFTVDFTDEKDQKKLALRDSIGRFAPAKIKSKLATKEAVILVDEENNIKEENDENVSDAGTYTIDEEEETLEKEPDLALPSEKVNSREWVSVWASNSFAEDNPIQEEDDEERSSSSQRRRLPATPLKQNGYQSKVRGVLMTHV